MKFTIWVMALALTFGCASTPEIRKARALEQRALEIHGLFAGYEQRALRQLDHAPLTLEQQNELRYALYNAVVLAGPTIETAIDLREFAAHETKNMSDKYKAQLERISRNLEFWLAQFEPKVERLRMVIGDPTRHQP